MTSSVKRPRGRSLLDLPLDRWSVSSRRSNDTTGAGPVGVLCPVAVRGLERPTDLTRRGRRRRSCGVRGATRSDQTTDLRPVPPDSPNA
ncbi:VMAP-C domain-containing protein [Streptomyces bobili]|uniref:VMAP-C domain-containing protein n=1 Tax=Streptomyces bobili TaxID=67280 RepID=UPI0037BCE8C1